MPPPPPPEEIALLMRCIAEKTKNVTSPINVAELCRQFQKETGSLVSVFALAQRINSHRDRIHEMVEFSTDTKMKMIFALSASIDKGFLVELQKVADVEVDDQQRIIRYNQKDGGLELSGKHLRLSINQKDQRDRSIIQFLVEKSETTDTPIPNEHFLIEFKESTGHTDSLVSLRKRFRRVKETIYQSSGIDKNTKIKIMFISNVKLPDDVLKELREDADVEVDEEGRITKYKSNDGSLELEGSHGLSSVMKSVYSDRWRTIYQKATENESEKGGDEDTNCQKDDEKEQIDFVRFLIKRTNNVTSPLSIKQLAKDYMEEFKSSKALTSMESRIQKFRQRIHEINQFDPSAKVMMMFALSVPIDANFLRELQTDAIVELDKHQRIKRYKAKDGSLELEGVHRTLARGKSGKGNEKKKTRVVNDLSDSVDSKSAITQNIATIQKRKKRARQVSEDEESLKLEDDSAMDYDTYNPEDFDYDLSSNELKMDYIPVDRKPETLIKVKTEVPEGPSTSNFEYRYEQRFFDYDTPTYEKDMEHASTENKPESLIEVRTEDPSTSNIEYHYEDNFEHILIKPKLE